MDGVHRSTAFCIQSPPNIKKKNKKKKSKIAIIKEIPVKIAVEKKKVPLDAFKNQCPHLFSYETATRL